MAERPRRMLAHDLVCPHRLEHREILAGTDVPQHHARIALQHPLLRALDGTPLERRCVFRRAHHENLARLRARALARSRIVKHRARGERGFTQRSRERHVPRTHLLGRLANFPFCNPLNDGTANAQAGNNSTRKHSTSELLPSP